MNELVLGRMKQGKTTFALYRARQHSKGVAVWDPRAMIDGVICYGPAALEDAIEQGKWKDGPLVYRFDNMQPREEFTLFCEVVFPPRFTLRRFAVVIDEAKQLQNSNYIHPSLDRAVTQHPRDVKLIQTSHSIQDWPRVSKDLVTDIWTFKQMGNSLNALIDFCDGDKVMEKAISSLPDHHMIHWDAATSTYELVNDPEEWFVPNVRQGINDPLGTGGVIM